MEPSCGDYFHHRTCPRVPWKGESPRGNRDLVSRAPKSGIVELACLLDRVWCLDCGRQKLQERLKEERFAQQDWHEQIRPIKHTDHVPQLKICSSGRVMGPFEHSTQDWTDSVHPCVRLFFLDRLLRGGSAVLAAHVYCVLNSRMAQCPR